MIFNLQKKNDVIPEIGDTFICLNGDKEYKITCKEADVNGSCSGCAFENMCKDYDENQTQFNCHFEDRPDRKNVIFVWE